LLGNDLLKKKDLKAELCLDKNETYFSGLRWEILGLIPPGDHRILDVGCGAGNLLNKLKESGKAREIVGIEINERLAGNLSSTLDKLYVGDVEIIDLPLAEEFFDYILFADVLEHLIDPWRVLHRYKRLLKNDGYMIATIPNIKNYHTLYRLIFFDDFEYKNEGVLDRSHLRFFTKREITKMFKDENFEVVDLIHLNASGTALSRLRNLSSFFATQYLIKVKEGNR
jgi:2-polyprenyl-3-methyl-5-hydroxy-6-metoxy-1,4-benzoquinol methylase